MSTCNCLIVSLYLFNLCIGCQWTVDGKTLDLSCLSGKELEAKQMDESGNIANDYKYTVCADAQPCESDTVMVAQRPTNLNQCFNCGTWDANILPTYDSDSGGKWTFIYVGASDCSSGRQWEPTFACDESKEYEIGTVTETPSGSCHYFVTINTKVYAKNIHLYISIDNVYMYIVCLRRRP